MAAVTIYALVDPSTDCIMYVGQSLDLRERFSSHCNPRPYDHTRRARWIRTLRKQKLRPHLIELETVEEPATAAEHFWISAFRVAGALLLNMTDGDDTIPPEQRARISNAHKGMKLSDKARNKLSKLRTGQKQSVATIEKRRIKLLNRQYQQTTLLKMTASAKRRTSSNTTRDKLSKRAKEQWEKQLLSGFKVVRRPLTRDEQVAAQEAMSACGGSKSRAAKQLNISRKRLRCLLAWTGV